MSREIKAVCVVAKPPRKSPRTSGVLLPVRFRYKVRDYTKGGEYYDTNRGIEHVLVFDGLVPVICSLRPGDVFAVAGVEVLVIWEGRAKRRRCVPVIHALEVMLSNGERHSETRESAEETKGLRPLPPAKSDTDIDNDPLVIRLREIMRRANGGQDWRPDYG
ncbi:hypothetical protein ACVY3D_001219 [Escherichia coli]|nr:hypothetical protein [Escherichia coli]EEY9274089.1 hypothetical protein [Escherichia coli]EFK5837512.1 hypothetical protein [Escherichia coli]